MATNREYLAGIYRKGGAVALMLGAVLIFIPLVGPLLAYRLARDPIEQLTPDALYFERIKASGQKNG